jgi:hypothetical protein
MMLAVTGLSSSKDLSILLPHSGFGTGAVGGNGLGATRSSNSSYCLQGALGVLAVSIGDLLAGVAMKADDKVFYSYNAVNNAVIDSMGHSSNVFGGQYFIDKTDVTKPIYVVITTPSFSADGRNYDINLNTIAEYSVTSQFSLVVGQKSYLFEPSSNSVWVD